MDENVVYYHFNIEGCLLLQRLKPSSSLFMEQVLRQVSGSHALELIFQT